MNFNIINNIKERKSETLFFILFCIGITYVSCFHEPRFDEFQAWGISKEPIKDILFVIPHIECHIPLWHLILKCFSYFNINPEIGIKIPTLLFMMGTAWLLIFKSPFHQIIKLTLPFTYFIFYQYSIINRPYSIFCFALFLIATLYKYKKEKPFLFVFANSILCLSCLHGMTVSAGIMLVWIFEIIKEKSFKFKIFIKDNRIKAITLMLLIGVLLFIGIFPDKTAIFNHQAYNTSNKFFSFLFATTGIFTEITYLTNISFINDIINNGGELKDVFFNINYLKFFLICIFGLIINIFFIINFKKLKVLTLYLIPLVFLSILYSQLITVHHIGLLFIFIIFVYWQGLEKGNNHINSKLFKMIKYTGLTILICTQLIWSFKIIYAEVKYISSPAKEIANYIKQNKFEQCKIMGNWLQYNIYRNKETKKYKTELPGRLYTDDNRLYEHINAEFITNIIQPVVIIQYFNKNIFYNLNPESPNKQYAQLKFLSEEETKNIKNLIKEKGMPDIIIGEVNLESIFSDVETSKYNYVLAKSIECKSIHKQKINNRKVNIYIEESILKEKS